MSYCRLSEDDSDVYIFGSGTHLECMIAWEVARNARLHQYYTVAYDDAGTAEKAMLGYCTYLRSRGIRVPYDATTRLRNEIGQIEQRRFTPPTSQQLVEEAVAEVELSDLTMDLFDGTGTVTFTLAPTTSTAWLVLDDETIQAGDPCPECGIETNSDSCGPVYCPVCEWQSAPCEHTNPDG